MKRRKKSKRTKPQRLDMTVTLIGEESIAAAKRRLRSLVNAVKRDGWRILFTCTGISVGIIRTDVTASVNAKKGE